MYKRKTVLIIDDSKTSRKMIQKILSSEDYFILEASNGEDGLKLLKNKYSEIEAIILDLVMPVMDGNEFLHIIKNIDEYKNIPVIVLTSINDEKEETKALRAGAWDFVSKPCNAEILKVRLKNVITRSQLSAFNQLQYIANYDTLTNIYNKKRFREATEEIIEMNPDKKFVLFRMDINRFSLINSFYGMAEGDKLLKYFAETVKTIASKYKLYSYGRIESDVFCMFILYENKIQIEDTVQMIKASLKAYNLFFDITPTIGVYILDNNESDTDVHQMYDNATLAAKQIKGDYINSFSIYDKKIGKSVEKEQEIINEMNYALDNEEFKVYLQPKYNLKNNSLSGAEALVRWVHPKKGIISPGEFIPVFERNGFISKLDYYMWEQVCILIRKWIDECMPVYPISVNISRVDLYNPNLVEIICDLVKKYDIPSELLNLELTESAYTDNPVALKNTMERLRENGFTTMMDDFGSGYSSLNLLKDVIVDVLKIDMKFLSNSEETDRWKSILTSVIKMAKALKIPTIAEGVETKEQAEFLKKIGCLYVQGFYFARPMPVLDYEKLINQEKNLIK